MELFIFARFHATVVPILVYEDVEKAIDWLCSTFGFMEHFQFAGKVFDLRCAASLRLAGNLSRIL